LDAPPASVYDEAKATASLGESGLPLNVFVPCSKVSLLCGNCQ